MTDNSFATTFRRNRSCERCRGLKVKCSYADPTSSMCLRCIRSKQPECVVLTTNTGGSGRISKRSANAAGSNGSNANQQQQQQQAVSQEQLVQQEKAIKDRRVPELEKLIRSAQAELKTLGVMDSHYVLERPNCIVTAIEQNLFDKQAAEEAYETFQLCASSHLSFELDALPFQESSNTSSLKTLAMIIAVRTSESRLKEEDMIQLLQRLVGMWLFGKPTTLEELRDVIKALAVMNSYLYSVPGGVHPSMYQMAAASAITGIVRARDWDFTINNDDELELARLYVGTYCDLFHTEHRQVLQLKESLLAALNSKGSTVFDKLLVLRVRMMLATLSFQPNDLYDGESVSQQIERATGELQQLSQETEGLPKLPADENFLPASSWFVSGSVDILERGLVHLVKLEQYDAVQPLLTRVLAHCHTHIQMFNNNTASFTKLVPSQILLACLDALSTMCRAQVIGAALGIDHDNNSDNDNNVNRAFTDVQSRWTLVASSNSLAHYLLPRLEAVGTQIGQASSALVTKDLLLKILHGKQTPGVQQLAYLFSKFM